MDWTGFVILKSRVTSHFIMIKIVNLSFFSAVWMNRHVRRLHIAITTNKGEARNFIILLHDHPNRIVGYILFSPVGNTRHIGNTSQILGICRANAGRQRIGIRCLCGAYHWISSRQINAIRPDFFRYL